MTVHLNGDQDGELARLQSLYPGQVTAPSDDGLTAVERERREIERRLGDAPKVRQPTNVVPIRRGK